MSRVTTQLSCHFCLLLAAIAVGCSDEQHKTEFNQVEQSKSHAESGEVETQDEQYRQRIVGRWEDDYKGHRTLTVRADGTATMVVELSGLSATLYAKVLTFQEQWTINDGRLVLKVTSGEPTARVKLILKALGDTSDMKILELSESSMRLLDTDGTEFHWRRMASE